MSALCRDTHLGSARGPGALEGQLGLAAGKDAVQVLRQAAGGGLQRSHCRALRDCWASLGSVPGAGGDHAVHDVGRGGAVHKVLEAHPAHSVVLAHGKGLHNAGCRFQAAARLHHAPAGLLYWHRTHCQANISITD